MDTQQNVYGLVTGAGKGLGNSFSIELAKRNHNVILVACRDEELEELRMSQTPVKNAISDSIKWFLKNRYLATTK